VSTHAAAPRYARPFAAAFLGAVAVCGFGSFNAWPFSNWELFSRLRTDAQTSWQAAAVGARPDAPVPHGYRELTSVMRGFAKLTPAEQNAICVRWTREAGARAVLVYRFDWLLSVRQGQRAAPPHRSLAWTCTAKGAHAAP